MPVEIKKFPRSARALLWYAAANAIVGGILCSDQPAIAQRPPAGTVAVPRAPGAVPLNETDDQTATKKQPVAEDETAAAAGLENEIPGASPPDGADGGGRSPAAHDPAAQSSMLPGVSPPAVLRVGPDTFLLPDEEGNAVPILGMTYEDFMKVWQQLQEIREADRRRRYEIQQLRIEGRGHESYVSLSVSVEVLLLTDDAVEVPLRLARALVLPSRQRRSEESSSTQPLVLFDESLGGLVARFDGNSGERKQLKLNVLVPLERVGSETILRLTCPRAVSSSLQLDLAESASESAASPGTVLKSVSMPDETTRLAVQGLAGEFELSWKTERVESTELTTVLSVSGKVSAHIDGRSIRSEARLSVQSFGGGFERFRVRLPPGAELVKTDRTDPEEQEPRYSADPLDRPPSAIADSPDKRSGRWYLIRLREKQTGPVDVTLSTEQPLGLSGSDLTAELGGFEVLGAVRQFGDLAVQVDDDWQLRWEVGSHVRQIDPGDLSESIAQRNWTAAFQYDRQPWSLPVRVLPRETRVHATPSYQLELLPYEARLKMEVDYHVPGARAFEFRTDLRGWEVTADPPESNGLDVRTRINRDDTLALQLAEGSPRHVQLVFYARRDLPLDNDRLELPLPVPLVDAVGPGELSVFGAPGLALTVDPEGLNGLSLQAVTPSLSLPPGFEHHQPLVFRSFLAKPTLAVHRVKRSQEIASRVRTRITLREASVGVEQTMRYDVHHQPATQLAMSVPAELMWDDRLPTFEFQSNDSDGDGHRGRTVLLETVELTNDRGVNQSVADDELPIQPVDRPLPPANRRVSVSLPQPRLGPVTVVVRYNLPGLSSRAAASTPLVVPLVMPLDGSLDENHVTVDSAASVEVLLDETQDANPWRSESMRRSADGRRMDAASSESNTRIPLAVRPAQRPSLRSTVVEKVWLQTWIAAGVQQSRAVYRFETDEPEVKVELPPDIAADQVEVQLDGKRARLEVQKSSPPTIELSDSSAGSSHTLELVYRERASLPLVGRRPLTPPLLAGGRTVEQVCWQIVMPGDTYLIDAGGHQPATGPWTWLGTNWSPQPTRTQAQLERWIGTEERIAPSAAENQYVFTFLGDVTSMEIVTARRWLIVLTASSAVLALGLMIVYIPAMRSRPAMAALGAGLFVLALAFPRSAALVGQAAVLGMLLVGAAGALRWILVRQSRGPMVTAGSSAVMVRPSATAEAYTPSPAGGSSTGTHSVAVHASAGE